MASFIARALPDLDPATHDWFPDDNGNVHEPDINIIAENGITLGAGSDRIRSGEHPKQASRSSQSP